MKKLFMMLGFLTLLLSLLSARMIFDGKIIFTSHATNKDSLAYLIIEKAGGVLDTVAGFDTLGNVIWIGDVVVTKSITFGDSLRASTSIWWYCKHVDGINMSEGGSGPTIQLPNDNTLGGWNLTRDIEFLYFNGEICNNWDAASDLEVEIRWELNSPGGENDSVFFDLKSWYKGDTEDTTKYQTSTEGESVDGDLQYEMFSTTFTIDYDLADNIIQEGDILSFRLNLNTTASDVDDVFLNFATFRYKTKVLQPTIY